MRYLCDKCDIIYLNKTETCSLCGEKVTPIFLPNWFELNHIQDILDKDITSEQFEDFVKEWEDSIAESISVKIGQILRDNF